MIYDSKDIFKKCTLNILYISCANTHNDVATFKLDIILQIQKKKKRKKEYLKNVTGFFHEITNFLIVSERLYFQKLPFLPEVTFYS